MLIASIVLIQLLSDTTETNFKRMENNSKDVLPLNQCLRHHCKKKCCNSFTTAEISGNAHEKWTLYLDLQTLP